DGPGHSGGRGHLSCDRMDPRNRNVVVTGAAGGIGGALVRALIGAGATTVVAADVAGDQLDAAVASLNASAAGTRVLARRLDVADEAATRQLVADVENEAGPIDLLFANAGIGGGGGADAPDADWDRQWRVNVLAHAYAARALLPGW